MTNKKDKKDIPTPEKDIKIEKGAPTFKEALVNFVKKTSKKPGDKQT